MKWLSSLPACIPVCNTACMLTAHANMFWVSGFVALEGGQKGADAYPRFKYI